MVVLLVVVVLLLVVALFVVVVLLAVVVTLVFVIPVVLHAPRPAAQAGYRRRGAEMNQIMAPLKTSWT